MEPITRQQLLFSGFEIFDAKVVQQNDLHNCGVFAISNLVDMLEFVDKQVKETSQTAAALKPLVLKELKEALKFRDRKSLELLRLAWARFLDQHPAYDDKDYGRIIENGITPMQFLRDAEFVELDLMEESSWAPPPPTARKIKAAVTHQVDGSAKKAKKRKLRSEIDWLYEPEDDLPPRSRTRILSPPTVGQSSIIPEIDLYEKHPIRVIVLVILNFILFPFVSIKFSRQNLVVAVREGNLYWLTQADIYAVLQIQYRLKDLAVGPSKVDLKHCVGKFKAARDKTLYPIVLNPGAHWTALVLHKVAGKLYAYHQDSEGKEIAASFQEVLLEHKFQIIDIRLKQQEDAYNCGVHAILNVKDMWKYLKKEEVNYGDAVAARMSRKDARRIILSVHSHETLSSYRVEFAETLQNSRAYDIDSGFVNTHEIGEKSSAPVELMADGLTLSEEELLDFGSPTPTVARPDESKPNTPEISISRQATSSSTPRVDEDKHANDYTLECITCPPDLLNGSIDVDLLLVVALDVLDLATGMNLRLTDINFWQWVQNRKMLIELRQKFRKVQNWVEWSLFDFGDDTIHVLFGMQANFKGFKLTACYRSLIRKAAKLMDPSTTTYKRSSDDSLTIYKDDYKEYFTTLKVLTKQYLVDNAQFVQEIMFYKAIHGTKGNVDDGLIKLRVCLINRPKSIVSIQIHYGCTIKAPKGSHIVLSYDKVSKVLGSQFVKENNYFLRQAGFFHGCKTPKKYPKVAYVHAYANIDASFSRHGRNHSLLGYFLTDKFAYEGESSEERKSSEGHLVQLSNWLDKSRTSMDCRLEIVKVLNGLQDLTTSNLIIRPWSFLDEKCDEAGLVDKKALGCDMWSIMRDLAREGSFLLIRGWERHVDVNMRPLVNTLIGIQKRSVLGLPREYFAVAYGCEMLSACFVEGKTERYDR
uniref:Ubiquitin-like protease family profile domain-containing protein n=1 Tax=Trichogramma kaykai TaxID=54128 RepID=A0ABD2VSS0_9HYME